MNYWLLKSEPSAYSWGNMEHDNTTRWDGVRNYQARNNMMAMKKGDLCFFYHSRITEPAIVGIVEVCETYTPDAHDPTFGAVSVRYKKPLTKPVTLARIKATPALFTLALIKQSRLSVMPVSSEQWSILLHMGNTEL